MQHLDSRVVNHSVTRLAKAHAEIDFFVIARRESGVETAEPLKQVPPYQQKGARAVIDIAAELVFGCEGVLSPAIAGTSPVVPDDAPGLLQRPVGQDQLAANSADIGRTV